MACWDVQRCRHLRHEYGIHINDDCCALIISLVDHPGNVFKKLIFSLKLDKNDEVCRDEEATCLIKH
uniref:Uncharacterized protein n=1 Tax=Oryza sativa subsp. japonica TaxID=39947 RepID=Q6ZGM8_ORYSJ|nr:hypothetical protein [Oryza sativa Japonica Group]